MGKPAIVLVWQGYVSGRTNKLFQIEISSFVLERLHKGDVERYSIIRKLKVCHMMSIFLNYSKTL